MTLGAFFTAAGYLVGGLVFLVAARQRRLATEGIGYVALAGLVGGVVSAKITEWVLNNWSLFSAQPAAILDPRLGGRTIVGGVIGGWISVEVAKWRMGIKRSTGDMFALALPAGEAVGRIGCFFNGCCYGVPTHLPWALYQHGEWRHPTQLYSSVVALAILLALVSVRDRMPREGDLFRLYLVLFGVTRFLLEFVRVRSNRVGGLSLAQWVCLEVAVLSVVALVISARGQRVRVDES